MHYNPPQFYIFAIPIVENTQKSVEWVPYLDSTLVEFATAAPRRPRASEQETEGKVLPVCEIFAQLTESDDSLVPKKNPLTPAAARFMSLELTRLAMVRFATYAGMNSSQKPKSVTITTHYQKKKKKLFCSSDFSQKKTLISLQFRREYTCGRVPILKCNLRNSMHRVIVFLEMERNSDTP